MTGELGHVAEGVNTALEITRQAQGVGIEMPICAAVCAVLEGRLKPRDAVELLMTRDQTSE